MLSYTVYYIYTTSTEGEYGWIYSHVYRYVVDCGSKAHVNILERRVAHEKNQGFWYG